MHRRWRSAKSFENFAWEDEDAAIGYGYWMPDATMADLQTFRAGRREKRQKVDVLVRVANDCGAR
jgi:hypothetical protein